jgi:hypothetical protein
MHGEVYADTATASYASAAAVVPNNSELMHAYAVRPRKDKRGVDLI